MNAGRDVWELQKAIERLMDYAPTDLAPELGDMIELAATLSILIERVRGARAA